MIGQKFIGRKAEKSFAESAKQIDKSFKVLEAHIIQVQENQVEFEQYLKEILKYVKNNN